jgi:hypothetical protein
MITYELGYAAARLAVEEAGTTRDHVWGSMIYACQGRSRGDAYDLPPCGHEERFYLGYAVEGPPSLKAQVTERMNELLDGDRPFPPDDVVSRAIRACRVGFLPVAFSAGRCPQCHGGEMQHVRWSEDEDFGELREPPPGARYFRVPDPAAAAHLAHDLSFGGAEPVSYTI